MSPNNVSTESRIKTLNGLFPRLVLIKRMDNPYEYSNTTKWFITGIVVLTAATVLMSASIFYSAIPDASDDLRVSPSAINVSVAAGFSELSGRRSVLLTTFALNIPFIAACALSPNIAFLIAFRLLAGSASASGQTVGAGVVADIWKPEERVFAMSMFYLGPLVAPLFLPLVGGALTQSWGWRSVMWFMAAQGALVFGLVSVALPETLRDVDDHGQPRESSAKFEMKQLLRPIKALRILQNPAVAITVFIASIAFGSCYILNISMQAAFSNPPYKYSPTVVGLLYLPNSVGCVLVSVFGGKYVDRIMIMGARRAERRREDGSLIFVPEDRLGVNAWVSLALYPASLACYGWLVESGVVTPAPIFATFTFGVGVMMIFSVTTTMAAEFVPNNSSVGVAVNNLLRNIFSSGGTAVTQPLLSLLGHGWLFTLLGLLAFVTGELGVVMVKKYADKWRQKAKGHVK
ncbi:major facilitator superfamily domain-containing protein [Stachybotrys elegans]|uniref:Major facilitator superfamily domain-containing protein n=1 Tax=Stachybotrys elegans TaxID=80388 RepID=A0A8K0SDE2_9HYPO|nr:major facilitator superfamily domain-containing protein [Stachybotrys elegans]